MKKGKLPPHKSPSLVMREVSVVASTANSINRTVRVVTATETPVMRYDDERGMVVKEVLLMDGMEMRPGRTQLPIVDSHDQSTIRNVVGSLRNVRIEGDEFGGDAFFASDAASQEAYSKLAEGHLTDFSITAEPLEVRFLQRGDTYRTTAGTVVEGPANIVTRWTPLDASLVACGADNYSTVRRSYIDAARKVTRMIDPSVLAAMSAMGLPEGMEDPNQVLAWVAGKLAAEGKEEADEPKDDKPVEMPLEPIESAAMEATEAEAKEEPKEEVTPVEMGMKVEEEVARRFEADRKRRKTIVEDCKLAKLERAFADELCDSGISVEEARERILRKMSTKEIGQSVEGAEIRITASEDDKLAAAMSAGLVQRAFKNARIKAKAEDAPGSADFANLNLKKLAAHCVKRMGVNTDRMTDAEIARLAMGSPGAVNKYRVQRDAYHTTGSFPNLLLDAANKTLRQAYEEAPYTWSIWARQAASVEDFKNINRISLGESPNLEMVPEAMEYPEKSISDAKTSYKVEKFGAIFSISWETVINDDLDAISRIPAMHGNAARRVQNKTVYDVLFANPTMSDGVALFSASHASGRNINSTAAALNVTLLNEMFSFMMLQKGQSSDAILNITPRYLLVPAALSATALELVNSQSYAQSNGNEGVVNIYGVNGQRPLTVVVEPLIDGHDNGAYYLAADPAQIDTVELSFLAGEESPVLESDLHFETDTYRYKVRQTFGAAAIDWRGISRCT